LLLEGLSCLSVYRYMDALSDDVLGHLFKQYARDLAFFVSQATRRWRLVATRKNADDDNDNNGAEPARTTPFSRTTLAQLIRSGSVELVERVLCLRRERCSGNNDGEEEDELTVSMRSFAAKVGRRDLLEAFLPSVWAVPDMSISDVLRQAAKHGHDDIVALYMSVPHLVARARYHNTLQSSMEEAARWGHLDIVRVIKQQQRPVHFSGQGLMMCAAAGGHLDIVKVCHTEWHVSSFIHSARNAASNNHAHIVEYIMSVVCDAVAVVIANLVMRVAASCGYLSLVVMCYDRWGAGNVDDALVAAAGENQIAIVQHCHDVWGVSVHGLERAILVAAHEGHDELVRLCFSWGARNVDEILVAAADRGSASLEIIRQCLEEWGATTVGRALVCASNHWHNMDVIALCIQHCQRRNALDPSTLVEVVQHAQAREEHELVEKIIVPFLQAQPATYMRDVLMGLH